MSGAVIETISMQEGQMVASHGPGSVADVLIKNNFNINALRTNGTLRKDEWIQMDNILIEVARERLVGVDTLTRRGLVFNISNGLGTTILEWERITDMEPAEVSMAGVTEGERDIQTYDLQSMPLPIIHKDFNINIRKLQASRTTGQSLDMSQTEMASRLVMEAIEQMLYIGNPTREATAQIFGLLNQPDRNVGSVTANWDLPATTGENKLQDIIAMLTAAAADNMYGPFAMYIPQVAFNNLMDDFKANSDKSQMLRLMETVGLQSIQASQNVTAGSIVMHQLTRDVVDEVIGLQPTVVQWDTNGGMTKNFKVMAIMIPRVRSTITGQSGVVQFS